jgi:hypothetical protein
VGAALAIVLALSTTASGCSAPSDQVSATEPSPSTTSSAPSTTERVPTTTATSLITTSTTTTTTTTTTTVAPAPSLPIALPDVPATALVDRLALADGTPPPDYVRDRFGDDWAYDPASGCNTRERVLIEEAIVAPAVDDRCRSSGGRWRSAYDGVEATDVAELQIDHLVPLADAWRAGAWRWTDAERFAFANDLGTPDALIAVTGSTNQSKSDSTPDEWLPPDRSAWCDYASAWVRVKARWALTVTPAEKATLVSVLSGC